MIGDGMRPDYDPVKRRLARLAAHPRCGMGWMPVELLMAPPDTGEEFEAHLHRCVRVSSHSGREHRCTCGSTKGKG